jgi:hypothetical protein
VKISQDAHNGEINNIDDTIAAAAAVFQLHTLLPTKQET